MRPRMAHSSTLNMEATPSSETLTSSSRHILDGINFHSHGREDLKFNIVYLSSMPGRSLCEGRC
jgi:hypothetical protein